MVPDTSTKTEVLGHRGLTFSHYATLEDPGATRGQPWLGCSAVLLR
jgi:hypothetical protein